MLCAASGLLQEMCLVHRTWCAAERALLRTCLLHRILLNPPTPWQRKKKEKKAMAVYTLIAVVCSTTFHLWLLFPKSFLFQWLLKLQPSHLNTRQLLPPAESVSFTSLVFWEAPPVTYQCLNLITRPLVGHPPFSWILLGRKRMSFGQNMQQGPSRAWI